MFTTMLTGLVVVWVVVAAGMVLGCVLVELRGGKWWK